MDGFSAGSSSVVDPLRASLPLLEGTVFLSWAPSNSPSLLSITKEPLRDPGAGGSIKDPLRLPSPSLGGSLRRGTLPKEPLFASGAGDLSFSTWIDGTNDAFLSRADSGGEAGSLAFRWGSSTGFWASSGLVFLAASVLGFTVFLVAGSSGFFAGSSGFLAGSSGFLAGSSGFFAGSSFFFAGSSGFLAGSWGFFSSGTVFLPSSIEGFFLTGSVDFFSGSLGLSTSGLGFSSGFFSGSFFLSSSFFAGSFFSGSFFSDSAFFSTGFFSGCFFFSGWSCWGSCFFACCSGFSFLRSSGFLSASCFSSVLVSSFAFSLAFSGAKRSQECQDESQAYETRAEMLHRTRETHTFDDEVCGRLFYASRVLKSDDIESWMFFDGLRNPESRWGGVTANRIVLTTRRHDLLLKQPGNCHLLFRFKRNC